MTSKPIHFAVSKPFLSADGQETPGFVVACNHDRRVNPTRQNWTTDFAGVTCKTCLWCNRKRMKPV